MEKRQNVHGGDTGHEIKRQISIRHTCASLARVGVGDVSASLNLAPEVGRNVGKRLEKFDEKKQVLEKVV